MHELNPTMISAHHRDKMQIHLEGYARGWRDADGEYGSYKCGSDVLRAEGIRFALAGTTYKSKPFGDVMALIEERAQHIANTIEED